MKYALVKDEKVINIIEAQHRNIENISKSLECSAVLCENLNVTIGDIYKDSAFKHIDGTDIAPTGNEAQIKDLSLQIDILNQRFLDSAEMILDLKIENDMNALKGGHINGKSI